MDVKITELSQLSREIFSLTAQLNHTLGPASLHADIIAAIRESLGQLDRDLCYAESFVEDSDDVVVREEQRLTINRIRQDYFTHKRLYRRAVAQTPFNLAKDRRRRLQVTLDATRNASASDDVNGDDGVVRALKSKRDANLSSAVLTASSDVTAELRKTHALMSEELSRTALSQELLDESSATLERLGEEYNTFGTILNGSKRLLKELENADRVDQLWIWGSFGFFCLVVAFILYRRILSRPVNALIWTGSFMFSRINQQKILQHQKQALQPQASISSITHSTSDAVETTPAEVVDMVIPELVVNEDQSARIARARTVPHQDKSGDDDIIHAEL